MNRSLLHASQNMQEVSLSIPCSFVHKRGFVYTHFLMPAWLTNKGDYMPQSIVCAQERDRSAERLNELKQVYNKLGHPDEYAEIDWLSLALGELS